MPSRGPKAIVRDEMPGSERTWHYPDELLGPLADLGLAPGLRTPPSLVREALNDLYRYELRRERRRLLAGDIEKAGYHGVVVALRRKYWPLTLPLPVWERICSPHAS